VETEPSAGGSSYAYRDYEQDGRGDKAGDDDAAPGSSGCQGLYLYLCIRERENRGREGWRPPGRTSENGRYVADARILGGPHQVVTSRSSREAIAVAGRFDPEVAILDVPMPELDGFELMAEEPAEAEAEAETDCSARPRAGRADRAAVGSANEIERVAERGKPDFQRHRARLAAGRAQVDELIVVDAAQVHAHGLR
jgi:hypothetical protein